MELCDGNWAVTTTAREDIRKSLAAAYEKVLDATLVPPEPVWIMSAATYHQLATFYIRAEWKEVYRAARVLKKRHLAYEHFGERRRMAVNQDGLGWEIW